MNSNRVNSRRLETQISSRSEIDGSGRRGSTGLEMLSVDGDLAEDDDFVEGDGDAYGGCFVGSGGRR